MRMRSDFFPSQVYPPLDVMRKTLSDMGIAFHEEAGSLFTRLPLKNQVVQVACWAEPDDIATVIVRLPVRVSPDFRAKAGEFLHRLNFNAKRKFWEINHDDGEVRLSCFTDTLVGPLTGRLFRALLNALLETANAAFPYLTSVLSGRMSPEFAADQAQAAVQTGWARENEDE